MRPAQITTYATAPAQTGITEMLNAMMPIIMLVMLMGMLTPMLKGVSAGA